MLEVAKLKVDKRTDTVVSPAFPCACGGKLVVDDSLEFVIDHVAGATTAYSPYLTLWLSEFNRLRLQYTRLEQPGLHENEFFLQWTVILGSHVHSFRDR